jgi:hypothetical protein
LLNTGVMTEYADGNGSILRKAITRTLDLEGFQDLERRYVTQ